MKVKDLKDQELRGIKVRIPKKYEDDYGKIKGVMILESMWRAGIWLKKEQKDDNTRLYPLCIDPREVLNFTVVK
jgi:hypothetical protein